MFHSRRAPRLGLSIAAAGIAIGMGATPALAAYVIPYDGTNPVSTGCANSAYTVKAWPMISTAGARIATAELRYSTTCRTNWVRVNLLGSGGTGTVYKTITRNKIETANEGVLLYFTQTEVDSMLSSSTYGMQVYAPGAVCVYSRAVIKNGGGQAVADTGSQFVC